MAARSGAATAMTGIFSLSLERVYVEVKHAAERRLTQLKEHIGVVHHAGEYDRAAAIRRNRNVSRRVDRLLARDLSGDEVVAAEIANGGFGIPATCASFELIPGYADSGGSFSNGCCVS